MTIDSVRTPPLAHLLDVPLGHPTRPSWRGRLHVFGLCAAVPASITLIAVANSTRARIAVLVYAIALCSMFAASATYHRWVHTVRARNRWRRADHAAIYAAIAGGMTPIGLLAVPPRWGVPVLVVMWAGGVVGMVMKLLGWRHQRIAGGVLYIALGWVGAAALPTVWQHVGVWPALLVFIGGAFYTLGAVGLYRRWPTLRPAVFSYHEVWHACTLAASAAHLAAIWIIVA